MGDVNKMTNRTKQIENLVNDFRNVNNLVNWGLREFSSNGLVEFNSLELMDHKEDCEKIFNNLTKKSLAYCILTSKDELPPNYEQAIILGKSYMKKLNKEINRKLYSGLGDFDKS